MQNITTIGHTVIQKYSTDAFESRRKCLSIEKLKNIIWKSEAEIANLSPKEVELYRNVREMAQMCGGWLAPFKKHLPDEPTLREYRII